MDKTTAANIKDSPRKKTRIQRENETRIVDAALYLFGAQGYTGTTVDDIAKRAGMSKANVLYYFKHKEDIYSAVLQHTLKVWLEPLRTLDPSGDPREELVRYTRAKLELSRTQPDASRLFANEVLRGAPVITPYFEQVLKGMVEETCAVLQQWMDDGKLVKVDPLHVLFMIWATTQHYADFSPQIKVLHKGSESELFHNAEHLLLTVMVDGLLTSAR